MRLHVQYREFCSVIKNCSARKVQRFLSQSFSVAEQFTGMPGQYVPLKETLRGFKMILDGECDSIPESCFLFAGTIDDVFEKAKNNQNQ